MRIFDLAKQHWIAAAVSAGLIVYLAILVPRQDWLANVGFLVLGVALSLATTGAIEVIKRQAERTDLAHALHEELANLVSRLCFDAESPWDKYRAAEGSAAEAMAPFRLLKFAPDLPLVYPSSAMRLTLLPRPIPGALIRFHYRLAALRRDIENLAAEAHQSGTSVPEKSLRLIARRQVEALRPGLNALEALAVLVHDAEAAEDSALRSYDQHREGEMRNTTLRNRIATVLGTRSAA